MDFTIGPVEVTALVLAITQAIKSIFGIEGKANQIVALVTGILLVGVSHGVQEGLIAPSYTPYIVWAAVSLAGGFAAIGAYEFGKKGVRLYKATNGH